MATTTQIRDAVIALVAAVPGIKAATAYAPEKIGATPAAWLGDDVDTIAMGALESHVHQLPLYLAVSRTAIYGNEMRAAEALEESVMAAVRSHVTLGGLVNLLTVERRQQGRIGNGGAEYVGCVFALRVHSKWATSLAG